MQSIDDNHPKLARIRALLAQSAEDSGATDAERAVFAERAAELMAKYMVTEAMLDAARNVADDPIEGTLIMIEEPYTSPKAVLLHIIAEALNCKVIFANRRREGNLYGHRSSIERVEFLYTSLLLQGVTAMSRAHVNDPRRVRSFRHAFLLAFASRIGDRMDAGRQEGVAEAGTGAELVLVDRKRQVDQYARSQSGPTRSGTIGASNLGGAHAGLAAADRADLGRSRVGGRRAISA